MKRCLSENREVAISIDIEALRGGYNSVFR